MIIRSEPAVSKRILSSSEDSSQCIFVSASESDIEIGEAVLLRFTSVRSADLQYREPPALVYKKPFPAAGALGVDDSDDIAILPATSSSAIGDAVCTPSFPLDPVTYSTPPETSSLSVL